MPTARLLSIIEMHGMSISGRYIVNAAEVALKPEPRQHSLDHLSYKVARSFSIKLLMNINERFGAAILFYARHDSAKMVWLQRECPSGCYHRSPGCVKSLSSPTPNLLLRDLIIYFNASIDASIKAPLRQKHLWMLLTRHDLSHAFEGCTAPLQFP